MSENTWQKALAKTHRTTFGRIAQMLGNSELDDQHWEQLEATLIQADVGVRTTGRLIEALQEGEREFGLTKGDQVRTLLKEHLVNILGESHLPQADRQPNVTLLIGVNGSGKTTSAAKLAHWYQLRGQTVLLSAADTYRAAASEQLSIWAERLGIDVIKSTPGNDPGAVVYDSCQTAKSRNIDQLIIDTAGRMHTEHNLMDELGKLARVCAKVIPGAPHTTLLVVDATTGQNSIAQASAFLDAISIDGTILAKLDGSAKGGIAVAIRDTLNLPVFFAGTGEFVDDFTRFDAHAYVQGLMGASQDSQ